MGGALVVLGCGGHARVCVDLAIECGYSPSACFDDNPAAEGPLGVNSGTLSDYFRRLETDASLATVPVMIGIGDNMARGEIVEKCISKSLKVLNLSHPRAIVSKRALISPGGVLSFGNSVINSNARVGKGVLVNTAAIIEHDCRVSDYASLGPGAILCGGVSVGYGAAIGAGAVILPGISIGDKCRVGAGAVVLNCVPAGQTVVGVPARSIGPDEGLNNGTM